MTGIGVLIITQLRGHLMYPTGMQPELFSLSAPQFTDFRAIQLNGRTREVSAVYAAYWNFAAERQAVYFRRLTGAHPITTDPILAKFKFTNAYRVLDRTTQYLLREVIMKGEQSARRELFFRILVLQTVQ